MFGTFNSAGAQANIKLIKIVAESKPYSDSWKACEGLIICGYDHYRVFHAHNEFVRGKFHVNGIKLPFGFKLIDD